MSMAYSLVASAVDYANAVNHLDDSQNELAAAEGALRKAQDEVDKKKSKAERACEEERKAWKALLEQQAQHNPEKEQA